nr:MAG TPA: hypothetical protein [Caudoviricetes sp.]
MLLVNLKSLISVWVSCSSQVSPPLNRFIFAHRKGSPEGLPFYIIDRLYKVHRSDMLPPLKSYDFEVGASCSIAF